MLKKITLFIILLSLFSCYEKKSPSDLRIPPSNINFKSNYQLVLADSIFAPVFEDIPVKAFSYKLYQDSLFYFSYSNNKLAVLNTNSEKIEKINIPDYLIKGSILGIDVISKDSVLLAQNLPLANLFLVKIDDSLSVEKRTLKKIKLKSDNVGFNDEYEDLDTYDTNFNLDYNNLFFDKESKNVHIGITPLDANLITGFDNAPRIGVYSWEDDNWESVYGEPNDVFKNKEDKTYGSSDLSYKQFLVKNDTTYINYRVNHRIAAFSKNALIKEFPVISSASKTIPYPITTKRASDIEETKEILNTYPQYPYFFYHSKLKLYSRIYIDEQNATDIDGNYNRHADRKAYFIFLNEKFEHVGDFKFPEKNFSYNLVPTTNGFLMFTNKYNDTDTNDAFFKLRYQYVIQKT